MGKISNLSKKIRDTKGIFHAKMGTVKDRNSMNLEEAVYIKNKWQGYTEGLDKKYLNDTDNYNGVITHLESDILECEVKWGLGSITTNNTSGSDAIPVELFQILNDDAVKVLHSMCQQIWKLSRGHRTGKVWFSFQSQRREMVKTVQTTTVLQRRSRSWLHVGTVSLTCFCYTVCVLSHFSHVRLFATRWTVALQAPLSMGFSRQEYWSGLPSPPPGDLPNPGIDSSSLISPALAGGWVLYHWEAHHSLPQRTLPFCLTVNWSAIVQLTER